VVETCERDHDFGIEIDACVRSCGRHATMAKDAREALALMREATAAGEPFDVALLDPNLPDLTGLALADEIAATADLRETRLILLSSSGQLTEERSHRISHRLTKPRANRVCSTPSRWR
jgi:CheY-like chemotaxis protein